MDIPNVDDIRVKDGMQEAWLGAIAQLRRQREVHPVDRLETPEGIGEFLVRFIAFFAVAAQKKIEAGKSLTHDDWWDLAHTTESIIRKQIANVGMYMIADTLREFWVYGDLIGGWIPPRE